MSSLIQPESKTLQTSNLYLNPSARSAKLLVDSILSVVFLLVTAPLWLIIAIAIKLESRGPVFFRQKRLGENGRVFSIYKFRSMTYDATVDDSHRRYMERMIRKNGNCNLGTCKIPSYKFTNEERLTRVGRFIRRCSLDELPQVLNVIRGEMSFVGPRPPIPYEVECYEAWHRKRLAIRPGMTGLWQVSGRYRLPFDQMVRMDIYYIENWSIMLDLKIMLKTLPALIMKERI